MPKNFASFKSMGTFITAQELKIITKFRTEAPFLWSMTHMGNAAYMGPADMLPRTNDNMIPLILDSFPKYLVIFSFATHVSKSAVRTNITGIIINISLM